MGQILLQDIQLLVEGLRAYFDLIFLDMPAGLGTRNTCDLCSI